jgi:hypothetical protein
MKSYSVSLCFWAVCCLPSGGTSPPSPCPYVVARDSSSYFFVMSPGRLDRKGDETGVCYHIEKDASLKKIWSVSDFYAFPRLVALSDDGRWLAHARYLRKGKTAKGTGFVDIYKDGRLHRTLTVGVFVDNVSNIPDAGGSGSDPDALHLLTDVSEQPLKFLGGIDRYQLLKSDGIEKHPEPFGADEVSGDYLAVTTYNGFRVLVNVETGQVTDRYVQRHHSETFQTQKDSKL